MICCVCVMRACVRVRLTCLSGEDGLGEERFCETGLCGIAGAFSTEALSAEGLIGTGGLRRHGDRGFQKRRCRSAGGPRWGKCDLSV